MKSNHWRAALMVAVAILAMVATMAALLVWEADEQRASVVPIVRTSMPDKEFVARGAYLARVGNCAGCHTTRGGDAFAGGLGIATPFGTVYTSNITPDVATGIGAWSAEDFWRAMHEGRASDGRLLYPAFPFPNYTNVTREDSDAIYAYLRAQPPVSRPNHAHELRFPYDTQAALSVWRLLFFRPAGYETDVEKTPEWNRGAYLVRGLGHCEACHSTRNALGATTGPLELDGGLIPTQHWYAPSLASGSQASVATWTIDDIASLLKSGTSAHGSVLGPMAKVVYDSTSHLSDADARAMAVFLKDLPQSPAAARVSTHEPEPIGMSAMVRGATLYKDRCADCHGAEGQGAAGAYPALAGSRKVVMASPTNVVRMVIDGGFAPTTDGNPRPYGMPPFAASLSDADIADVITYARNSWGNRAGSVSELDVLRARR